MANYIIRVELLGAPDETVYGNLHAFMASQGFSMNTTNADGDQVTLPQATYFGESSLRPGEAADRLRNALQAEVWTRAKVLAVIYSAAGLAS